MKKTVVKSILCLIAAFMLLALVSPAYASSKNYTHPTKNFSISYPADWTVVMNQHKTDIMGLAPFAPTDTVIPANFSVVVNNNQQEIDMQQALPFLREYMKKSFQNYKEHQAGNDTIGGMKAVFIVFSSTTEGHNIKYIIYFMSQGTTNCILMGGSGESKFNSYQAALKGIAKTFRLGK